VARLPALHGGRPIINVAAADIHSNGAGPGFETVPYLETIAAFLAEDDSPISVVFPQLLPAGVIMLLHGEPRSRKSLAQLPRFWKRSADISASCVGIE
jgi:hypothetical protein